MCFRITSGSGMDQAAAQARVFRKARSEYCPDLIDAYGVHVLLGAHYYKLFVPVGRHLQSLVDAEDGTPFELRVGFIAIELKKLRFMGGIFNRKILPGALTPIVNEPLNKL